MRKTILENDRDDVIDKGRFQKMLTESQVATRLPVGDLGRARRFYSEKLGLEPVQERPGSLRYRCGCGYVAPVRGRGSRLRQSHPNGVGGCRHRIRCSLAQSTWVVFEEYDLPGLKTVNGIADIEGNYPSKGVGERAAWFKDSEGNLLGLGQPVPR